MASQVESDFEMAQRLHRELNEPFDFVMISDTEEEMTRDVKDVKSALAIKEEVRFDHQQAITIKKEKSSDKDFFLRKMGTYLDLSTTPEWSEVNLACDLQHILDKLQKSFFKKAAAYTIKWDINHVISDGSSFRFFEPHKEVLVNTAMMVRPRIQLISIIFHILIHIYLNTSSAGKIALRSHEDSFREIFLFFNKTLKTEISTCHKIPHSADEDECSNQWYQCVGICSQYMPFRGVVRCTTIPSEVQSFWKQHKNNCGGQFFKIFEVERFNNETQGLEKKFVRNIRYMFPKPLEVKNRAKATSAPRELFDLTEDDEEAKVQNLCEFVNLDDSEFNFEGVEPQADTSKPLDVVKNVIGKSKPHYSKCSICEEIVVGDQYPSHLDSCRGYQQKVLNKIELRPRK